MTLAIDIDTVDEVLLADGWHRVTGSTFEIDAYEYIQRPSNPKKDIDIRFGGGGDDSVGFMSTEQLPAGSTTSTGKKRARIKGPISSILAVREES